MKSKGSERLTDPDPYILASTIFAAVCAATGVYALHQTRQTQRGRQRGQRIRALAAIHRWEANLLELKELLTDIQEFTDDVGLKDSPSGEAVLAPFEVRLDLMPEQVGRYKGLLSRLHSKAKNLSNDTFSLLNTLQDDRRTLRLQKSITGIKMSLRELQKMKSVRVSLGIASATVEQLIQAAERLKADD